MDENKIFDLLEKIYIEVQETKIEVKIHTKRLDNIESKFDNLDTKVDNLESKVDNLESKVGNIELKVENLESKVDNLDSSVKKIGAKIDGEITVSLKILSEEQSIMRKDIKDIKDRQEIHDIKIDDLRLVVDSLSHKQKDQEKEIRELRTVK